MSNSRHTLQRQTVLLAVKSSGRFLRAEEVFQLVKRKCPGIGLATVYRNLDHLAKRSEIFSFEDRDGVRRYAGFAFHDSSFTCERCGRRVDVPLRDFEDQLMQALRGRTIYFSRLDVRGLCRQCAADRKRELKNIV